MDKAFFFVVKKMYRIACIHFCYINILLHNLVSNHNHVINNIYQRLWD